MCVIYIVSYIASILYRLTCILHVYFPFYSMHIATYFSYINMYIFLTLHITKFVVFLFLFLMYIYLVLFWMAAR
jgi:hypothetical protein